MIAESDAKVSLISGAGKFEKAIADGKDKNERSLAENITHWESEVGQTIALFKTALEAFEKAYTDPSFEPHGTSLTKKIKELREEIGSLV